MRDQNAGDGVQDLAQLVGDQRLGLHVKRRQGVVENQNRRAGNDRACQGEPLPLPAGQAGALLADAGVEPEGQVIDELRSRNVDRCYQLRVRGIGAPEPEFSATDMENSVGSSKAVAMVSRRADRLRSRMS